MKLPKTLLAAIIAGITVQVVATSCSKDGDLGPKDPPTAEVPKPKPPFPDNCPACGLG